MLRPDLIAAAVRRGKPPARVRKQREPVAIQRRYFGRFGPLLKDMQTLVAKRLVPELPRLAREAVHARGSATQLRKDAARGDEDLGEILDELTDELFEKWTRAEFAKVVRPVALATSDMQREQLMGQLRDALGIDVVQSEPWLGPMIDAFTRENVALIKSIPSQFFGQLEKQLSSQIADGIRHEEMIDGIAELYGVTERRANLIARDQVGKFHGDLNRVRQTDLGILRYTWRTMRDNRVREDHEERDGESYGWDEPPEDGHPGEAVLCRCYADPDTDAIFREAEESLGRG